MCVAMQILTSGICTIFCSEFLGEKLQTEDELEENRKRGGGSTVHFMNELPEYEEIYEKYYGEERKLEAYRAECKDEALDLLKEYFYSLWT